jgi:hypothetical protein
MRDSWMVEQTTRSDITFLTRTSSACRGRDKHINKAYNSSQICQFIRWLIRITEAFSFLALNGPASLDSSPSPDRLIPAILAV